MPLRHPMKHPLAFSTIILLTGLAACAGSAPGDHRTDQPLTESEVIEAVQHYDRSWAQRDTAAVARLLDDAYVYFSSVGDLRTRHYVLEDLLGNPSYQLESRRTELQVQLHGNTAIVGSRWWGQGTYEGRPNRDDQRCSLVLVKDATRLAIVAEHCTQIVAKGESPDTASET